MSESRNVRIAGGTYFICFWLWLIVVELAALVLWLNRIAHALQALAVVRG